jgi:hypothetical protein
MRLNSFRKIMAWVSLLTALFFAGNGSCFTDDVQTTPASFSDNAGPANTNAGYAKKIPCCPDDNGFAAVHGIPCFACSCHVASLSAPRPLPGYAPSLITISFLEYSNAPSDAFRSIFVPPQNLA